MDEAEIARLRLIYAANYKVLRALDDLEIAFERYVELCNNRKLLRVQLAYLNMTPDTKLAKLLAQNALNDFRDAHVRFDIVISQFVH